jgi:glycosyltransferase involved in cell wall biosynthesis
MKVIVQIPCLNEQDTLPATLRDIPREIEGVDKIEILVIDDGSMDRTVEVAREHGVDHIVRLNKTQGLAKAFTAGLEASLRLGADIIVNTDADNQYRGADIPNLISPVLKGEADIVIGCRPIDDMEHFSWGKKMLQKVGSWVVSQLANLGVEDVTSGFRAYSRDAALRINVLSDFTYTLETVIQAGKKDLSLVCVSVGTNKVLRPSRLFSSTASYVKRSLGTIVRIYSMYEPLKVFSYLGGALCLAGVALCIRYLVFWLRGQGWGHVQSLILAAVLLMLGFQTLVTGLMADLTSANRRLIEDTLRRVRSLEITGEVGTRRDSSEQCRS